MGFSQSVIRSQAPSIIRSQAPAKCGICKTERSIKWKCIDCSKLLCNHCKESVHPELKNTENHQVVNIKDVGQPTVVELNIYKQYQTELSLISVLSYSHDDTLWIYSDTDEEVLQRVKPEGTKLNILSSFNIVVYDSVYNVSPLEPTAVHVTSDNKVLVGCVNKDYPKQGRRVVILMNHNGDQERVYEHDQHKQPIFTYPRRLTSTSNGNIHVVDRISAGRLVE
ncbi:Hypothetical predicted protein [Mytilus galloprovincialis]|uniref:B box-type domain-containing protein n=1 Tax=Mytilus galloprovincialis TaxID=29158 RepID=A0A8B6G3I5_MYTGA|nr:Hypothetical predicted protein [Mytilus galloprovincialis]